MSRAFKLQDPGEGIREAEILAVLISEGDSVSEGDPIFEVETDKATMEVHADFSGTIDEIRVNEGSVAQVGEVLVTYEARDARQADDQKADEQQQKGENESRTKKGQTKESQTKSADDEERDHDEGREAHAKHSSKGRQDAKEEQADEQEAGAPSSESDSSRAMGEHESERGRGKAKHTEEGNSRAAHPGPAAAPSTRRLARELDVDLKEMDGGSGPNGRIIDDDVEAAAGTSSDQARKKDTSSRDKKADAAKADEADDRADDAQRRSIAEVNEQHREPLRGVRRATAKRMARSWQIPQVMHHDLATIDELLLLRRQHAELASEESGQEPVKPTITSYVVKALASALRRHPNFNVRLDADTEEIVTLSSRHIGVAVATGRGLFVPVLRDVDQRSLADVARDLEHLSERARQGELEASEMRGASTTLTNVGGIGGRSFTPIINAPQSSILGVGAAFEEYVADKNRQPKLVTRLPLSFAFDHRLNDGAQAAHFVNTIKQMLSSPAWFSLLV